MTRSWTLFLAAVSATFGPACSNEFAGEQRAPLSSITWQNAVGVTISDSNGLEKTGTAGWNAGASSTVSISGDGAVEFSTAESNTNKMLALSNGDFDLGYESLAFAIYLRANRDIRIYESGTDRGVVGQYNAWDMFRIEVLGSEVRYLRNGTLLHTSAVRPSFPLLVDTSLHTAGATIEGVSFGPMGGSFWQYEIGVLTTGNSVMKTGGSGWNAGASSTETLVDDGHVEFTTGEQDTVKMAGLSSADSNASYEDIDFAFYLRTGGRLRVYERGLDRGAVGNYSPGDVLRIEVSSGMLRYLRNGTVVYMSSRSPTFPLLFDTSLYTTGATVTNVVLTTGAFWQFTTGVFATFNSIEKTGSNGWNAGASTVEALAGPGYVEFTTREDDTAKMVGLSNGDSNASYYDIDFAFYLRPGGRVRVYEGGVDRGHVGDYAPGDVFRIEATSEAIRYLRNAAVVYTSGASPAFPLLLDTSLYTTGSTITDVVFGP